MRIHVLALAVLGLLALPLGSPTPAWSEPSASDAPSANKVIVRGKKTFPEALEVAAQPAWSSGVARPVLLVIDVTPFTRKGRTAIEEGLAVLAREGTGVPSWSVAALGGKPSKPVTSPLALGTALGKALEKETDVVSTFTALSKTLKKWREKDGVVVYVADWHFEDDVDLEGFIKDLQRKGRTLAVVGTEAAFRRGWNDGLKDNTERFTEDVRGFDFEDYWEGVGRDPFGGRDAKAPWHGGDTAYPYAPYRWDTWLWKTAFSQSDWDLADLDEKLEDLLGGTEESEESEGRDSSEKEERLDKLREERAEVNEKIGDLLEKIIDSEDDEETRRLEAEQERLQDEHDRLVKEIEALEAEMASGDGTDEPELPGMPGGPVDPEDLRERLPGGVDPDAKPPEWIDPTDVIREFPLPSSYGPYGLMRAAGVTGGRYVLFSWNPSGRKTVVYEYNRCSLFPPDLRSRKEILADLRSNPWARSVLEAWWIILEGRTDVLEQLPAVKKNLRSAGSMDRIRGAEIGLLSWESPGEQKTFIRVTEKSMEVVDKALVRLDALLEGAGETANDVEQRYEAEALLFRHALRVARFELNESLCAAREVPRSAWREKRHEPGVGRRRWLNRGRDPERVRAQDDVRPYDPDAGRRILEERKALLARFRGTPLGEELAMNDVNSREPDWWERVDQGPDSGRSPAESTDTPEPTRPSPKPPGPSSGGGGPSTGGR